MRHDLIPCILLSFGHVCSALVPSSFLLPSCLAAASRVVFSPWHTLMQLMTRLPLVMLSISVGCWLILVSFDSLLLGSSFSTVYSSLRELLHLCRIFSRLLSQFSRFFRFSPCRPTWVSTSHPYSFHPSRFWLVFLPGSSTFVITFLHRFHLLSAAPALSLSLPHFIRLYSLYFTVRSFCFCVVSPFLNDILLLCFLFFISLV